MEASFFARPVEPECLKDDIHTDLVSELEAISDRFFRAIYANLDAINFVLFDACCETGLGESINDNRRMVDPWRLSWFSVNWKKWPWLLANRVRVVQVSC